MPTLARLSGLLLALAGALAMQLAAAAELHLEIGGKTTLTTEQLLARPDARRIEVPGDVSYRRAMTYRAVPLRDLPGMARLGAGEDLQIVASDGFVTNLPKSLVLPDTGTGAQAWLAIEPGDQPWPRTASGKVAGPFYLVWLHPEASGVRSEQWPYQIAAMRAVPTRAGKWPQIEVGSEVPADSVLRRGQKVVATQCMACHKLNGAGDATLAPDLNVPHGPTEYFQPWVLRQFIRDPRSIRSWPDMKMPPFPPSSLDDADLDAAIAYLSYMASKRK